jgi:menaquinone-dependent protoporphyrinogen IX oxidase
MKRHPTLTFRKPEGISKAAAQITTKDIEDFIAGIVKYLDDKGLTDFLNAHPENFINMDETAFELNMHADKVLTDKSIPHTLDREVTSHHKKVTSTITIGADGTMWTPQIIFKEGFKKVVEVALAAGGKFSNK